MRLEKPIITPLGDYYLKSHKKGHWHWSSYDNINLHPPKPNPDLDHACLCDAPITFPLITNVHGAYRPNLDKPIDQATIHALW